MNAALQPQPVRVQKRMLPGRRTPVVLTDDEAVVVAACARAFGVEAKVLAMADRRRRESQARMACYRLLHRALGLSTTRIGAVLNRDHTTAIHGAGNGFMKQSLDESFRSRFMQANEDVCAALGVAPAKLPEPSDAAAHVRGMIVRVPREPVPEIPRPDPFAGIRFENHPRSSPRRFSIAARQEKAHG